MKNYKLVIISLLLVIFMVGAVSAADDDLADDNLEITDEVSVDEAVASDVEEIEEDYGTVQSELAVVDTQDDSLDDVLADDDDEIPVIVVDKNIPYELDEIQVLYGEEKNFTVRFITAEGNPYSYTNLEFQFYGDDDELPHFKEVTTDADGYATFLIDYTIGHYTMWFYVIDGVEYQLFTPIAVIDPNIKGYLYLWGDGFRELEEYQVIIYGDSIKFFATLSDMYNSPIFGANISYSINNMNYSDTTFDGGIGMAMISIQLDSLPIGNHTLVVSYPELNLTTSYPIYVLSEPITTIVADNLTVVGEDEIEYVVKLTDKLGRPVSSGQWATMWINSNRYGPTYSDEDGICIFYLNLAPGVYNNVKIADQYESVYRTIIVLANSSISADDNATFDCGGENSYSMSFTNVDGTPLVNGTVDVIIDDNENYHYVLTTDENGTVSVDLSNLPGGNHTISIVNLATGEKTSTTVNLLKGKTTISTAAVTTVYNGGKYVIFTLKNDKGAVLAGKSVSVVLNGKTIKGTTDKNGQFKVSTDGLAPKAYSATMTFAGDDYLIGSTATAKITVNKATPKLTAKKATFKTKTKKYTITLKDNKNKAMKKVKVTLKVKGKTYKATTNAKGKATFKLTKFTKKGKYTAKVKFAGNKNFKAVTKSVKLTVKK